MGNEESKLLLLGIGGGGGRVAAAVRASYAGDMRVLCIDSDALSNREIQQVAKVPCILFGARRLAGNGAAGDPIQARDAFKDETQLLEPNLAGVRTAIILTCLGAGTGSGATPEVARILRSMGIVTLCIATYPFRFEGQSRQAVAERMRSSIESRVNALAEVRLDDLFAATGEETVEAANQAANETLARGVTLLWRMVSRPGFVCTDPERLRSLIAHGLHVRFDSAVASGDNRVARLTDTLRANRILRKSDRDKARAILVGILGGNDLRLAEITDIMATLHGWYPPTDCITEVATLLDPALDGRIELVVFAFENCALEPPLLIPETIVRSKPGKAAKPPVDFEARETQNLDEPTFRRHNIRLDP